MAQYYSIRRFCPYQGVIQVVDVGNARAYSTDGRHWQVRVQNAAGRLRWHATDCDAGDLASRETNADQLMQALNERPPIPFPLADRFELWLLHHESRLPLAIVKSRVTREEVEQDRITNPTWQPFLMSSNEFRSPALEAARGNPDARARHTRARDVLERQVNMAGRPLPVLQWFERLNDASGIGHGGMRVEGALAGRHLPAEAFPELLVDPDWEQPLERDLVREYHEWNAPFLLAHQRLSENTRGWLETAARQRPETLLENYPMYPQVLDAEAMQVSLVSAKLIKAS
ncbi:hypothetical protein [Thiohalobacter thiocyanaticus]|uniref:Uncharacterized protein n=1 Tax=Thiohalobacter thiocyanaticus TaxID=585455 RepID=A0A426QJV8_9GAMM|nr:hypothetical protein [Thiohalobacter thiocyanaticus]RRQ22020.1 hypothetical protein D6C00_08710 [Thiohalobacter thiocyanaticus]